ncbi:hypothetical protein AB4Y45_32380 [Paraburkholderia sp. EG287A]|uniref:hypothetical protein n=1 Tax=Paraburkholderia sp. EG287A TaxID=3237012 RepID=UPI0034D2D55C
MSRPFPFLAPARSAPTRLAIPLCQSRFEVYTPQANWSYRNPTNREEIMGMSINCFASRQTVSERDRCRVVPIYQSAAYSPHTLNIKGVRVEVRAARSSWSSEHGWRPVGEFFPANVHGVGQMELVMSEHARLQQVRFLHYLCEHAPTVEQEDGRPDTGFDIRVFVRKASPALASKLNGALAEAVKADIGPEFDQVLSECFDYVYQAASDHRVYVLDTLGKPRPLEFAVIHEDAYQALLALPPRGYHRVALAAQISALPATFAEASAEGGEADWHDLTVKFVRASRLVELLTEQTDQSRSLVVIRRYLNAFGSELFGGGMKVEDAYARLKPDVEDIYAFSALDDLGIALSPVLYSAEEDYDNHCGRTYLDFVSNVNRAASRSRNVRNHGKYRRYETLAMPDDVKKLTEASQAWDCGFELIGTEPAFAKGAFQKVIFEMTASPDYVLEWLEEENFPPLTTGHLKLVE